MIRTRILLISLCAMGTLAAGLGVSQMWWDVLDWDLFLKIMATIIILGTEASFLMAVDYDFPASRRKWLMIGLVIVSALASTIVGAQIWFLAFDWSVFVKVLATLGIGVLLLGFLLAVAEDFGGNKQLKDQNFID